MTYCDMAALALENGFDKAKVVDTADILFDFSFVKYCAENLCGNYGANYTCPPGCGTLEECGEKIKVCTHGILVQTYGDIEDGFDFEAMMEIEADHKEHFLEMYARLRETASQVLALGAGCCTVCAKCTYPDEPCRFPEKMISSMEAYGMLVLEICKRNGLTYYYGADKMAYTSCFLLR